jgi:ADP-ribosyl-[dinitrogen reductase] hydrolase
MSIPPPPIPDSYWVDPGRLLAGEYPGSKREAEARAKLRRFLEAGITLFIDLTESRELKPYTKFLREEAAAMGVTAEHVRLSIPDLGTPGPALVTRILDEIDAAVAAGGRAFVHCWGGVGRTGTIAGCYLVRHGMSGEQALAEIARLRAGTPDGHKTSPETPEQREFVRKWRERPRVGPRDLTNRARGVAVGAAVGDALGMPLEFKAPVPPNRLVRAMTAGRLHAGAFTDDTEMALALADSLLEKTPFDPANLARHFVRWYETRPPDVGVHTATVLREISLGCAWQTASYAAHQAHAHSAGNGSVMRSWPVALAGWDDLDALLRDSRVQSEVTHAHPECLAACAFVNAAIHFLLLGNKPADAIAHALDASAPPSSFRAAIEAAPAKRRDALPNTGWVRHTVESAVWGLLTTTSFDEAVVQVVNLGNDADTAGTVAGALAGAAYGYSAIPAGWRNALRGEWPVRSGEQWDAARFAGLADRLIQR